MLSPVEKELVSKGHNSLKQMNTSSSSDEYDDNDDSGETRGGMTSLAAPDLTGVGGYAILWRWVEHSGRGNNKKE